MVLRTIKSTREIDALFSEGVRTAHSHVLALVKPTPAGRGPQGRVVFVAGKRLGGAVVRNRAKRVLRASVRRTGVNWEGFDVALIARPTTGSATPKELDQSLRRALSRAGVSND